MSRGEGKEIKGLGWPARKFYLSPEAFDLLKAHCEGTPLTMSAYVDMLIKQALNPIVATNRGEPPAVAEERARKAALERGITEAHAAVNARQTPTIEQSKQAMAEHAAFLRKAGGDKPEEHPRERAGLVRGVDEVYESKRRAAEERARKAGLERGLEELKSLEQKLRNAATPKKDFKLDV